MRRYTQSEALHTIFNRIGRRKTYMSPVHRTRYKKGKLSQKSIDQILLKNGFQVCQTTLYTRSQYTPRAPKVVVKKSPLKENFVEFKVPDNVYNRVVRVLTRNDGGTSDLEVALHHYKKLANDPKFIRIKCAGEYADITIFNIKIQNNKIKIKFEKLIDHSKAVIFKKKP